MKEYDKIYVPDDKGELKVQQFYEDYREWTDMHDGTGDVSELSNVVVFTHKELHDLLDDICYQITEKGMGGCSVIHHFTSNYLKGKLNTK